jgi:hypothetical protein
MRRSANAAYLLWLHQPSMQSKLEAKKRGHSRMALNFCGVNQYGQLGKEQQHPRVTARNNSF